LGSKVPYLTVVLASRALSHPQACEFVSRTTVTMDGQQASTAAPPARVKLDSDQAKGINTKPDRAGVNPD
jgi:hypothetical protein